MKKRKRYISRKRYTRKGGAGFSGSLREQFSYYKRQMKERLVSEQAFKYGRTFELPTEGRRRYSLFLDENLDYNKVFFEGITRKVGKETIRYYGEEAVKIQIESFRKRASKSYQRNLFVDNYISAMKDKGYSRAQQEEVYRTFNKLSTDRLAYLVDAGYIPQIEYVYAEEDKKMTLERIINASKSGVSKEELEEVRGRARRKRSSIKDLLSS